MADLEHAGRIAQRLLAVDQPPSSVEIIQEFDLQVDRVHAPTGADIVAFRLKPLGQSRELRFVVPALQWAQIVGRTGSGNGGESSG